MSGSYLYCQNHKCGVYLGSLGSDDCGICGWRAPLPEQDDAAEIARLSAALAETRAQLEEERAKWAALKPVAWCVPAAEEGKPQFGRGWMFSPVPTGNATMPLCAAPPLAIIPGEAL